MEKSGETDTNQVKLELTKDIVKLKMVKPVVSGVAISEQLSIYHPNIKIETVKVRAKKLSLNSTWQYFPSRYWKLTLRELRLAYCCQIEWPQLKG